MKIATQTECLMGRYPMDRVIDKIAAAGFDHIDYSLFSLPAQPDHPLRQADYKEYLEKLRIHARDAGVSFHQAHAPFPSHYPNAQIGSDMAAYNDTIEQYLQLAIEAAGRLGCAQIVVHPVSFGSEKARQTEWNLQMYRRLGKTAREFGTRIAVENMFGRSKGRTIIPNVCSYGEELAAFYDLLGDRETFTVCLDIGHCGLVGDTPGGAIRTLGDRLGALHVHDNDYVRDMHQLPMTQLMDWKDITAALREIKYAGVFTLEADYFIRFMADECLDPALRLMAAVARHLANQSSVE